MTETPILTPARADDCAHVARLHYLSHRISYAAALGAAWSLTRTEADYQTEWCARMRAAEPGDHTLIAWLGADPVGFIHIEPLSRRYRYFDQAAAAGLDPAQTGVVRHLHAHPDHLGMGIGGRLMGAGKAYMRAQGWSAAVLDTQALNARARRFYAADGWALAGPLTPPDAPLALLLYRCDLGVRTAPCST